MHANTAAWKMGSTTVDLNSALITPDKVKESNNNHGETSFLTPVSSTNSRKGLFCRICHVGEGSPNSTSSHREPLIAPCKCTGTMALIHLSCLEHWLTTSNSDRCELCNYAYEITRVPMTVNQDFLWFQQYFRDRNNQFNVRNLIADVVCFMLLTPLLVVSTYLCILGANQYVGKERWEAVGLIILSLFLMGVYFTWCHVTTRYHISVWRAWQRSNQHVRVTFPTSSLETATSLGS